MNHKPLIAVGVALILVLLPGAGGQQNGLSLLVQHIRMIGARQWLGLMAGSIVPGALAIPLLTDRIARLLPGRAVAPAESAASTAATA